MLLIKPASINAEETTLFLLHLSVNELKRNSLEKFFILSNKIIIILWCFYFTTIDFIYHNMTLYNLLVS